MKSAISVTNWKSGLQITNNKTSVNGKLKVHQNTFWEQADTIVVHAVEWYVMAWRINSHRPWFVTLVTDVYIRYKKFNKSSVGKPAKNTP